MEILCLQITITEMKYSLEMLSSRSEIVGKKGGEINDREIEMIQKDHFLFPERKEKKEK